MKHYLLILFILVLTTSCKQEVAFAPVENTPLEFPATPIEQELEVEIEEPSDPIPPVVHILQAPKSHFQGLETSVSFEVVKGTNPIADLKCKVGILPLPCRLGIKILPLIDFLIGDYRLNIKAVDTEGLQGHAEVTWSVFNRYKETTSAIVVEPEGKKADILFVIDNSASMSEEQRGIGKRINRFLDVISKLDWRIGIITTDPYAKIPSNQRPNPYADGSLVPFPNGEYQINASLGSSKAQELFAKTIYRKEGGNGHERGIRNTYRSVERSLNPVTEADNRLNIFFRADASFSAVIISDENETLLDGGGKPLLEQEKSSGSSLLSFLKQAWGETKKIQFNSVIIKPGDKKCIGAHEKHGYAYAELSELTGGVVEDICAKDYSSALRKIAAGVVNLERAYELDCVPEDTDNNGVPDLEILGMSGQKIPNYIIDGNKVEFDEPLKPGNYDFNYYCPNTASI